MVVEAGSKIALKSLPNKGFHASTKSSYPDSYPLFEALQRFYLAKVSFPFVGNPSASWGSPPTRGSVRKFEAGSSQGLAMKATPRTKMRSRILEAVHSTAADLHKVGVIDARQMREYDALYGRSAFTKSAARKG